ncbi:MAG: phosphatidylglycerophosphatase A [Spirochaetia bacterium]|nr:phosphatidylglycerophosphatase A [Spirochaetia bacterium]
MKVEKLIEFIASGFYTGFLPHAPGTWGSLAAILISFILGYYFPDESGIFFIVLTFAVFTIGLFVSEKAAFESGEKDPSWIVIDEFAGVFIIFCFVPAAIFYLAAGFILFRFFDIFKPWPLNIIQNLRGGWGIMLDDLLAGVYSVAILLLLNRSISI